MRIQGAYAQAYQVLLDRRLKQGLYQDCPDLMAGVVLNLEGEAHLMRRKLMAPVFSAKQFRTLEAWLDAFIVQPGAEAMRAVGSGDLVAFAEEVSLVMALRLLGLSCDPQRYSQLLNLVRTFGEGATSAHSLEQKLALNDRVVNSLKVFDKEFLTPERTNRREGSMAPMDNLLTLLFRAEKEGVLTSDQLLRDAAFFLQASVFSTTNAVVNAFHESMKKQRLLVEDICSEPHLLRLQRWVHEALRLHPASSVMRRKRALGLDVIEPESDEVLEVSVLEANRDPLVFGSDAEGFDPSRRVSGQRPFVGLSFGAGHHSCPGRIMVAGSVLTEDRSGRGDQVGLITRVIAAIARRGLHQNEAEPPTRKQNTTREIWASYPLIAKAQEQANV